MVWETVEFNHQSPLLVVAEDTSFAVVLGSNEYADHGINTLVGVNIDLVGERLVVHAELSGLDNEFLLRLVDVYGAGDVKVKLFEVGDELFNLNGVNLDSLEDQLFAQVAGEVGLVTKEQARDSGQETVVYGITKEGLVVLNDAGNLLVSVDVSKDLERQLVELAVEVVVDGINSGFDELSKKVNAVFFSKLYLFAGLGNQVTVVNGITNAGLEVVDQLDFVIVELVDVSVVSADGEFFTIGVTEVGFVSLFDGLIPVEDIDINEVVGETFQDVTGKDLLVSVVEKFTTVLLVVSVGGVHPEGAVHVQVVVVGVQSNVFSEVGNSVFFGAVVEGVVTIDVALVGIVFLVVGVLVVGVHASLVDGNNQHLAEFRDGQNHAFLISFLDDLKIKTIVLLRASSQSER